MGLKKSHYLKKIIFIFAVLLVLLGIFRMNVREFFSLKQEAENSFSLQNDKFAFVGLEHTGVMLENTEINSAIFILPDTGYEYRIEELIIGYKNQKNFDQNIHIAPETIYLTKEDTSCIYEETCGENFEKILNLAEKYSMLPKTYDLTDKIILPNNKKNTNIVIFDK